MKSQGLSAVPLLVLSTIAAAHSASDAYLTLTIDSGRKSTLHGQWDIALRDLDFALQLDDDGDGELTWGEVKRHQASIDRYAYAQLRFNDESGAVCSIEPTHQLVDAHADGVYAALFFDVRCPRPPQALTMSYGLFFSVDPSHRGIFVMHAGNGTSTAVLSPKNAKVVLALQ